ncbi:hypothetical protein D9611_013950 [Ephemerocybe angulata]|uniref:Uncharacterized protein n=1 Tax=Ephemerocybe angulata TaxID=980116 RepID=A0A8H5ARN7_9AGAR|nr:hypothetical protein D9611_013950 [Tulosesus angulatus]
MSKVEMRGKWPLDIYKLSIVDSRLQGDDNSRHRNTAQRLATSSRLLEMRGPPGSKSPSIDANAARRSLHPEIEMPDGRRRPVAARPWSRINDFLEATAKTTAPAARLTSITSRKAQKHRRRRWTTTESVPLPAPTTSALLPGYPRLTLTSTSTTTPHERNKLNFDPPETMTSLDGVGNGCEGTWPRSGVQGCVSKRRHASIPLTNSPIPGTWTTTANAHDTEVIHTSRCPQNLKKPSARDPDSIKPHTHLAIPSRSSRTSYARTAVFASRTGTRRRRRCKAPASRSLCTTSEHPNLRTDTRGVDDDDNSGGGERKRVVVHERIAAASSALQVNAHIPPDPALASYPRATSASPSTSTTTAHVPCAQASGVDDSHRTAHRVTGTDKVDSG